MDGGCVLDARARTQHRAVVRFADRAVLDGNLRQQPVRLLRVARLRYGVANYYCNGVGTPGTGLPNCDIYYNKNISHDRQIAGFGEVTYSLTDQWKLTAGGRFAKMQFNLQHYANGLENAGLGTFSGSYQEHTFTPKASVSYQVRSAQPLLRDLCQRIPSGWRQCPLAVCHCRGIHAERFHSRTTRRATRSEPRTTSTTGSRSRAACTTSSGTASSRISTMSGPPAAAAFNTPATWATRWRRASTCRLDAELWGGLSIEATVGYTSARYTKDSPLVTTGDAISGEAAINYSPGTNAPWNVAIGPQYNFSLGGVEAFVRADWNYASRNHWLASVQDPNSTQYQSVLLHAARRRAFIVAASRHEARHVAGVGVLRQSVQYAPGTELRARAERLQQSRRDRHRRSRTTSRSDRARSASPRRSRISSSGKALPGEGAPRRSARQHASGLESAVGALKRPRAPTRRRTHP